MMRATSRLQSRGGTQRAVKFIRSEKEEHTFPEGKGGGREGNIRGKMKEELVVKALTVLKDSKRIVDFLKEDGEGKDFLVWLTKAQRKNRRRQSIEVKSSKRGRDKYMRKLENMTKRKKKGEEVKIVSADLLIVVRDDDNILTLIDRIAMELGLS